MSTESKKVDGYVNLNYCVMSVFNELGGYDATKYKRFLQFAIDAYIDLSIHYTTNIEVAYLTMNDINTIDFPTDYVDYTAIGINRGGKLWMLTEKPELLLPRDESCGEREAVSYESDDISPNQGDNIYGFTYSSHLRDGGYIPTVYGSGGGFNTGYFRIDDERRQIIFHGDLSGEIVLEYKSTGVKVSGSTIVPREAVNVIKKYIHMTRINYDPRVPMNDKEIKKGEYWTSKRIYHAHNDSMNTQEWMDIKYKYSKQTPKR